MRLFEPAQGLLAVTGYNGRGVTTGTVVGKAFADYLLSGERATLPLPFSDMKPVPAARLRSCAYEMGFLSITPVNACAWFSRFDRIKVCFQQNNDSLL